MAFMLRSFGQNTDASSPNRFVPKGSRPVTKRENGKSTRRASDFFFHGKNLLKQLLKQRRKEKEPPKYRFVSAIKLKAKITSLASSVWTAKKKVQLTRFFNRSLRTLFAPLHFLVTPKPMLWFALSGH